MKRATKRARIVSAVATAAAISVATAPMALADYSSIAAYDMGDGTDPTSWILPANWNPDVVPASTAVAEIPLGGPISLNGNQTIYGVRFINPGGFAGTLRLGEGTPAGSTLTLLSEDAVMDVATNKAPAIFIAPDVTGEMFQTDAPLVLGNVADGGTHRAYILNNSASTGKSIVINDRITEFAGANWGLTFTTDTGSTAQTELKGGNYLTGGYQYSGDTQVNSRLRIYNALIPVGPGAGNVSVDGGGELRMSQNGGVFAINGLNSTSSTGVVASQSGGNRPLAVGGNNASGNFAGSIGTTGATSFPVIKIGSGTQVLSNSANAWTGATYLVNGVLSVNSVANGGTASALGRGNTDDALTVGVNETTSTLVFDGATLQYTGAGHSTDRLFTVGIRGGTLDASGTGAVNFNSADPIVLSDSAYALIKNNAADSTTATVLSRLDGLAALLPNLTAEGVSGTTSVTAGSTIAAINEGAGTITFDAATVGAPGSGSGYPFVQFTATTAVDRTLNLTGTSTADNTLAAALGGTSTAGGQLGINKTGAGTWVLTGANTYTGATTVNAGTLAVTPSAIAPGSAVTVNGGAYELRGPGGPNFTLFNPTNVTVNGSGTVRVGASGGYSVLRDGNLAIPATGKIDLVDNKLITSQPLGSWNGTTYTGVSGKILAGRGSAGGNAQWNGTSGITTSDARAIDSSNRTSLGVIDASDKFRQPGGAPIGEADTALFAGQTVTGADTLVMFTYGGDANLDGKINIDDYGRIDSNVGTPGSNGWANGDFNYDGKINIDDYGIIDSNISQQTSGIFPTAAGAEGVASLSASSAVDGVSAVPEPASLSLVAVGAMSLLRRRRRVN